MSQKKIKGLTIENNRNILFFINHNIMNNDKFMYLQIEPKTIDDVNKSIISTL